MKYHNNNDFVHDWSLLSLKKSVIECLFSIIYHFLVKDGITFYIKITQIVKSNLASVMA